MIQSLEHCFWDSSYSRLLAKDLNRNSKRKSAYKPNEDNIEKAMGTQLGEVLKEYPALKNLSQILVRLLQVKQKEHAFLVQIFCTSRSRVFRD